MDQDHEEDAFDGPALGTPEEESEELRKLISLYSTHKKRSDGESPFNSHLWPLLVEKGWTYEDQVRVPKEKDPQPDHGVTADLSTPGKKSASKSADRYFIPPGIERKKPFKNRVDYFDSTRAVICCAYFKKRSVRAAMRMYLRYVEKSGGEVVPAKSKRQRREELKAARSSPGMKLSEQKKSHEKKKRRRKSDDNDTYVHIGEEERAAAFSVLFSSSDEEDMVAEDNDHNEETEEEEEEEEEEGQKVGEGAYYSYHHSSLPFPSVIPKKKNLNSTGQTS
jgi:hypothetical protein